MNYVLNDEKMFADITDGIAIIINSETGIYYGMNALGTAVYENLINGASTESILAELKSMPDVPENLEENFNSFIKSLAEKEVILESAPSEGSVSILYETAKEDNFILDVREYNDAQELLLADPIHEVKEESGWTPEKSSLNPDKEDVKRREAKMEV